jgi:hypothetical protein
MIGVHDKKNRNMKKKHKLYPNNNNNNNVILAVLRYVLINAEKFIFGN